MKIGILTYHRAINYGAILQAYALQTYLKGRGYDAKIIDYWPDYHKQIYKLWSWKIFKSYKWTSKIKYTIYAILKSIRFHIKKRKFEFFIGHNLDITQEKKFDIVIYGSDQIWRKQHYLDNHSDYNPTYFGNGLVYTNFKISYAASMGKLNDSPADIKYLKNNLTNFSAISVREKDLFDLLKDIVKIEVVHVIDPTLLVEKNVWDKLLSKYQLSMPKKKYILYYRLHPNTRSDKATKEIANEMGLAIKIVNGTPEPFHYAKKYEETASVEDFLWLMQNADFVVTTSFHGLAMAIQYNKQFYAFTYKRTHNRLQSLLNSLNIRNRLNPNYICINDTIDYELVNKTLKCERNKSSRWLNQQIENCCL